jgi:hypothetical protein
MGWTSNVTVGEGDFAVSEMPVALTITVCCEVMLE